MEANITGMTELFNQSIGITEPWYIRSIETVNNEVHVYVDIRDGNILPCPECGEMCQRAGYEKLERVWRHADCLLYPCYVHCRRPRIVCKEHKTKVVEAPWSRKNSRFTLMFEGYAMMLLADMPIRKASKALKCNEKSLVKMLRYWVSDAVERDDLSKVESISVDETSFKKGQSYVTVVIDGKARRVIDVEDGRNAETIVKFSEKLEKKGGNCNKITQYVCDMSTAYKAGKEICFPYAQLIIDKFHVKQIVLQGMDEVRREEQGKIAKGRKLLMIPQNRQTKMQSEKITELSKAYPNTGRAYRMVQALDEVYKCQTPNDAERMLNRLIGWMQRSRLKPMKKVAGTLKERRKNILAYFQNRVTNAICEGINSMIQAAKRKARGYHTFEGYSSMIYLIAAKLKLACGNPLRKLE